MTSVNECCAWFDAAREIVEVQGGQLTKNYITMIVEAVGRVLCTLRYDVEKGKNNLIGIIIDDPEYLSCTSPLGIRVPNDEFRTSPGTCSRTRPSTSSKCPEKFISWPVFIEDTNLYPTL